MDMGRGVRSRGGYLSPQPTVHGGLGERRKLPGGIWGGAPDEIEFDRIMKAKKAIR